MAMVNLKPPGFSSRLILLYSHDIPSTDLIPRLSEFDYGNQLLGRKQTFIDIFSSTRDHSRLVPQILAIVDTGRDIKMWTLDAAVILFQDQSVESFASKRNKSMKRGFTLYIVTPVC
jgi:hypothetical protein